VVSTQRTCFLGYSREVCVGSASSSSNHISADSSAQSPLPALHRSSRVWVTIVGVCLTCVMLVCSTLTMRSTLVAATLAAALAAPTYQLVRNPLPPRFCDPTSQGESGYLKIQDEFGSKSYFYQFWQSRHQPSTDPVALWLTGGPGCSSQLALYTENGPCEVNSDGTVSFNPYAWNQNASVIWLDQPAGAGFSTGDTDTNQAGTSEDIWYFLQAFFSVG